MSAAAHDLALYQCMQRNYRRIEEWTRANPDGGTVRPRGAAWLLSRVATLDECEKLGTDLNFLAYDFAVCKNRVCDPPP